MRIVLFFVAVVAVAVVAVAMVALGQELSLRPGRMTANSIVRPRPDGNSPAVYQLPKDTPVRIIAGAERGEFVRVVAAKGPVGWVPREAVAPSGSPAPAACPQPETAAATKKKSQGNPVILDFNDVLKLQLQAERMVGLGQELTPQQRGPLASLAIAESRTGEGAPVRIGGYFAAKPEGPRVSPPCTGGSPEDWILNITDSAGLKEFQGLIARIPAQKRNPKWSLAKLRMAWEKQYPVLVTGTLFYDAASLPNDDSSNPLTGILPRNTLWEIRQVTSILVCTGGTCEPGSAKGWVALEQLN